MAHDYQKIKYKELHKLQVTYYNISELEKE